MGYDLFPRNKKSSGWSGNITLMNIVCSIMKLAGVGKKIIMKFNFNQGDYVKKCETLEIAEKMEKLMSKTPKFIFKPIDLISNNRVINEVMLHLIGGTQTWDGKEKANKTTIIYKSDALWQEIENFIKCCRESRGFWVR